jgi:outer membrane biosynthesis protein TonB
VIGTVTANGGKMFDKLIESNSEGAEFKNRRSYFMVSSVVVGLLFLAAVVASIYAGDIGLGQDEIELSTMIAPIMPETQPEPEPPRAQNHETQQTIEATRQSNMVRPDESPIIPTSISVVNNTQLARPTNGDRFRITNDPETNGSGPIGVGRETNGDPNGNGLSKVTVAEDRDISTPPPAMKPDLPKRPISIGVANGKAINLPKPPYPAAALAINAQGKVDVQVTIDERGNVIASKAVSGHPLLKGPAEKAAWSAKFTPTLLSNVPVKVTGVIVYNFTRN